MMIKTDTPGITRAPSGAKPTRQQEENVVARLLESEQKINYRDHFELVVLRWRELTKALERFPDAKSKYKIYDHTIRTAANAFGNNPKYRNVLAANSFDADDLYSMGLGWTTNYFLYELPPERDLANDNKRLLYTHLMQRMTEFVQTLFKKQKNVLVDREVGSTFSLGSYSTRISQPDMEAEVDRAWLRRNKMVASDEKKRGIAARRVLIEQLALVPHAKMVELLEGAANNESLCPDSRDQAQALLDQAQACSPEKPCPPCGARGRDMDKKIKPLIADPKSTPKTISIPQANSLELVRKVVESTAKGDGAAFEATGTVRGDAKTVRRHRLYYRQAARDLGFLATNRGGKEWSPTRHAFELLATVPGSHEERLCLRQRISESPGLSLVAWYFNPPNELHSQMVTLIMSKTGRKARLCAELDFLTKEVSRIAGLSLETARRRASTLVHWREYAWDSQQLDLPATTI